MGKHDIEVKFKKDGTVRVTGNDGEIFKRVEPDFDEVIVRISVVIKKKKVVAAKLIVDEFKEILIKPVEKLGFGTITINRCRNNHMYYLCDIIVRTENEIRKSGGIGEKITQNIKEAVEAHEYTLGVVFSKRVKEELRSRGIKSACL